MTKVFASVPPKASRSAWITPSDFSFDIIVFEFTLNNDIIILGDNMISKERQKHIFAVAQLMQQYGKEKNFSVDKCNELFTLGLLHDVGYAFLDEKDYEKHETVGGEALRKQGYKYWKEVYYHTQANAPYQSEYLDLLNLADMHIDSEGNYVEFDEKLEELSKRYNVQIENLNSYPIVCELKAKGFK